MRHVCGDGDTELPVHSSHVEIVMMRSFVLAAALSAFGLFASACGDDEYLDIEVEELLRSPTEILIQEVVVHKTDSNGCYWDGPTCTPIFETGYELPDPYAVAYLNYNDGTTDGPIISPTCQDKLKCSFSNFGFSLRDPVEESWANIRELRVVVWDEDGVDDDKIGEYVIPHSALQKAFNDTKVRGYSIIKSDLTDRIISVRLRVN